MTNSNVKQIKLTLQHRLQFVKRYPTVFHFISFFATGLGFISIAQAIATDKGDHFYWLGFGFLLLITHSIVKIAEKGLVPELLTECYLVAESLEQEVKITQRKLFLNRLMARVLKGAIDVHISDDSIDTDSLVQDVILSAVEKTKEDLFGITNDEMWNFVVYVYNPDTRQLECRAHALSDTHPSYDQQNSSPTNRRAWKPNDKSHISETYKKNEPFSIYDYTEQGARASIGPVPVRKRKNYDEETYCSFVAIPLTEGEAGRAIGVFAATSNVPNRFNVTNQHYLVDISRPLSSLYALSRHDAL